ncbi:PepSY domain-containing protein [Sphingomonas sp. LB-2]|uniref:PepSY-associated TM helix domain-containing protein n=1 Tax=Sphingomonas caeni TaxID=2984949 RepID=UPI00223011C3|nr:PepSY domain-containing protein [Sphingomonas caeni]MCW3847483.1 PepSY domain-containing protein [Sphingomonas caeni]
MTSTIRPAGGFYRAIWRWHFYAGVIVLPVMLWLAATGALYLYKPEIETWLYRDWNAVQPTGQAQPIAELIASVERATGGTVTQVSRPASPAESWRMTFKAGEAKRTAFVDPYRGTVLGTANAGGMMATVRDLHSLAITGPIGNALIEIVAGWAVVLVVTGLILWWPRGGSPAIGARGKPGGRVFWRDLHASIGVAAAAVILFLAVTGMPWSGVAGEWLDGWVNAHGWGRPERPAPGALAQRHEGHEGHHEGAESLPWSMQRARAPTSGAGRVTPDLVAERALWSGLAAPWTMTLPARPGAPWLVSAAIVRAEDAHAVYIDAATGSVLQDARYGDFGGGAQAIEWGIATHQGQQYGEPNRLAMLTGCIAVWLLAGTGLAAWWKRRRGGRLRAPPPALDRRRSLAVAAAMAALGMLFPLTGLTMLAALAGEGALALARRH